MTRDEALKLLRGGPEGIKEWNALRIAGELMALPPGGEFLRELLEPTFVGVDLQGADLRGADLHGAELYVADLSRADLRAANLSDLHLSRSRLVKAILQHANLDHTLLSDSDLSGADLSSANLSHANLRYTNMTGVNLSYANLFYTDLKGADLGDANLHSAHLIRSYVPVARFHGAFFSETVIACDLSRASGLGEVRHGGPSDVTVDSILQFKKRLPESFLRGCGLREEEIAYFRSQVGQANRFYSCFISYSTPDEAFATRLHNDFQAAGIRCWKWDHDARTGQSLWGEIDQAIRVHDKVVLIASESSLKSPAVNREIERAICEEDRRIRKKGAGEFAGDVNVLFPVRVDDYIFAAWEHERKVDVTKKVIADARGWDKDDAVYRQVRDRLIRDLKTSTG